MYKLLDTCFFTFCSCVENNLVLSYILYLDDTIPGPPWLVYVRFAFCLVRGDDTSKNLGSTYLAEMTPARICDVMMSTAWREGHQNWREG